MTRYQNLQLKAKQCGLSVAKWSPGDGMTRYRFYVTGLYNDEGADYFALMNPTFTACGLGDAHTWVNGYRSGLHRFGLLVDTVEEGNDA